jgi:hypothetical protein
MSIKGGLRIIPLPSLVCHPGPESGQGAGGDGPPTHRSNDVSLDQKDGSAPPHSLRLSLLELLLGLRKRNVLLHHFLGALGANLFSSNIEEVHSDRHPLIDLVPEPWAAVHLVENRVRPRQAREFLPRVCGRVSRQTNPNFE